MLLQRVIKLILFLISTYPHNELSSYLMSEYDSFIWTSSLKYFAIHIAC